AFTVKAATRSANQRRAAQLAIELATIESQIARVASLDGSIAGFEADLAHNRIDHEAQELLSVVQTQLAELAYDPVLVGALWTELQGLQHARVDYAQLAVMIERASALEQRSVDTTEQLQLATHAMQQAEHELKRIEDRCTELLPLLGDRDVSAPPAQLASMAEVDLNSRTDFASQLRVKLQAAYQSQSRIEEFHTQLQSATVLHGRYDTLEKAFASKGLQAMLIRDFAVPALERETNRILSRMTDNQLYLNINTSATSQTGNARETLELEVSDAAGTRPLEAFSGGEAFRISFALRIALSRLLAHRAGHRLETLIIDEGFGTQDAQGRDRLVEAINAISTDFRTIMVITHVAEVRDLFPVQIGITRNEHGSSWEVRS
ncbi:MAG: SbcC/MukB-like Walker B domain-containing protein, partial [Roseiflexaceae bacterium]